MKTLTQPKRKRKIKKTLKNAKKLNKKLPKVRSRKKLKKKDKHLSRDKSLLLSLSIMFGAAFDGFLLFYESLVDQFATSALLVFEFLGLVYGLLLTIMIIDLLFKRHRDSRIWFINILIIVLAWLIIDQNPALAERIALFHLLFHP